MDGFQRGFWFKATIKAVPRPRSAFLKLSKPLRLSNRGRKKLKSKSKKLIEIGTLKKHVSRNLKFWKLLRKFLSNYNVEIVSVHYSIKLNMKIWREELRLQRRNRENLNILSAPAAWKERKCFQLWNLCREIQKGISSNYKSNSGKSSQNLPKNWNWIKLKNTIVKNHIAARKCQVSIWRWNLS